MRAARLALSTASRREPCSKARPTQSWATTCSAIARDPGLRLEVYEQLREYCHQCRNRLNSLKLSLYLAMRQSSLPTSDPWAEIEQHYRDLERRVEQVQFLCRPLVLSRVTLGLDLLIDDRREKWTRQMAEQGRGLELIPPTDRAVASFDVERLGRALDSVVAWRASERSAGRSARLSWWVEGDLAHIAWEEADSTTPSGRPVADDRSLGLDLAASRTVALAHGGDYRIETDRGWRLDLAWPITTYHASNSTRGDPMNVFTRSIGAKWLPESPYVLLVDDEEASFLPLVELVRFAGFASVAARSATDALACCYHRRPDVVVTDLDMPGPDGRALARRLRKRFPDVPIVLVTGQNLEDPAWAVPEGLFEAVFSKPLDFDRFIRLVGRLMPPSRRVGPGRGRP